MNVKINVEVNFLQISHSLSLLGTLGELSVFGQECLLLWSGLTET